MTASRSGPPVVGWRLRGLNYVGTVVAGPLSIIIRPKVDGLSVLWMLDGHRIRAALDAECKCHDSQADVYQALAYAKGLGRAAASRRRPSVRQRLTTVPGVGWVLGYTIAAEISDIERFASPKKRVGYSAC